MTEAVNFTRAPNKHNHCFLQRITTVTTRMPPKSSVSTTSICEMDMKAAADYDPKAVTSMLSEELMKLNSEDRNQITEEMHGVRNMSLQETPDVQTRALGMLQNQLDRMPPSKKAAYDKAQGLEKTYVNDDKFRLRFLRAELFDVDRAAERMTSHLDLILELFGDEVLARPLRTTDFKGKLVKRILPGGLVQLLPYRDRSGRRVMVILSDVMSYNHIARVRRA